MPVMTCIKNGKHGFKWGDSGFCYTYQSGNKNSIIIARKKALSQGKAIQANQ